LTRYETAWWCAIKKVEIDAKAIKTKLALKDDREKVSLYLSKSLYSSFKRACESAPASRVMEELMIEFIRSAKR
jgi:hypothetical protein